MQRSEYDSLHKMWDASHAENSAIFRLRSSLLLKMIPTHGADRKALDAGCGTGFYSRTLLERGFIVDAFDLSDYAVEVIANNLSPEKASRFFPEVSDIFNYKSKHAPYSLIILSEVLEHIRDDIGALKSLSSHLEKDGNLIMTVPIGPQLYSHDDELSGHVRRYTKKELYRTMDDAGFEIIETKIYGFPMLYLYLLCKKLFLKKEILEQAMESGSMNEVRQLPHFIPSMMINIDRMFLWTQQGVGAVIKARKK